MLYRGGRILFPLLTFPLCGGNRISELGLGSLSPSHLVFPEETWWRKWTSLAQHLSHPFLWEPAGPWKACAPGCPPQDLSFAKGFAPGSWQPSSGALYWETHLSIELHWFLHDQLYQWWGNSPAWMTSCPCLVSQLVQHPVLIYQTLPNKDRITNDHSLSLGVWLCIYPTKCL